jgi:hypothetical protein
MAPETEDHQTSNTCLTRSENNFARLIMARTAARQRLTLMHHAHLFEGFTNAEGK